MQHLVQIRNRAIQEQREAAAQEALARVQALADSPYGRWLQLQTGAPQRPAQPNTEQAKAHRKWLARRREAEIQTQHARRMEHARIQAAAEAELMRHEDEQARVQAIVAAELQRRRHAFHYIHQAKKAVVGHQNITEAQETLQKRYDVRKAELKRQEAAKKAELKRQEAARKAELKRQEAAKKRHEAAKKAELKRQEAEAHKAATTLVMLHKA